MARLNAIAPVLPANNIRSTTSWFVQQLDFSDAWAYPEEAPTYGGVAREGVEIHFFETVIDPKKSNWMCYIRVTGIEALYERCSERGIVHPNAHLQTKPWNQREFAVTDPNGTQITFGESVKP